uniref:Uncharacterized protein n=1 Tax=Roseihalotalea indica TaxID=2867963 RepID=A0AA49JEL5_9BACT|nr:hypothetical protein K4G66_18750 [Tunicatimonas sp. TK19036]
MTQRLLHWVSCPVGLLALTLWISLAVLALRQCRAWAKREKLFHQNHPSIPEVTCVASPKSGHQEGAEFSVTQADAPPKVATNSSFNVWDV